MDFKKIIKKIRVNKPIIYISPFIIYLIVSYILFGPTHFSDIHRLFFTPSGDPYAFVWYLKWWPFSLMHGLNPIFERFVYYPDGFNLAWSTSIPSLAIFMAPVTAIWGAITSFNVLALVALPFSSLCCFYLIYYITKKYIGSMLCGFIYGFSSFQLGELLGHPNLYVSFVAPLVVLVIMLRVKNHLSRLLFIILLALLLAIQFGITSEVFGSMFLFGAFIWLLFYFLGDKKLRPVFFKTSKEIIISTLVTLVIVSPFIYYLFVGYSAVPKVINSSINYSTDLLNFILPTKITLIGGGTFDNISKNFAGNPSEQGAYLTIPLIIFMIGFSIYYWKKWYVKILAIMAAALSICSLGPKLQINGKIDSIPLPWSIFNSLPVLRSMLPIRFPMYLFLIASIMLGLWLTFKTKKVRDQKTKFIPVFKYGLIILVIILLLPKPSNFSWQKVNIPPLFTPKLASKYLGQNKNLLILPYNDGADPELWQAASNMQFKTVNGYLGFVPPFVIGDPTAVAFSSDMPSKNFKDSFLVFCKRHQISEIIYTPQGKADYINDLKFIQTLGWETFNVGGATIIKVPPQYK